jgi:hypothetical protein
LPNKTTPHQDQMSDFLHFYANTLSLLLGLSAQTAQ